ncbi:MULTISPECIES: PFL_4669 family integrating conjugative element protein [Enterobacterales]|uniref:TIGR03761 family integrating conjugative element protein n=3 Tax=Yersinia TaxID=629 RepID=A0A857ETX3_9GAMM|nr:MULTISPECIES: TIGR03761 family integrating conjugative element protein [Enterobacterales]EKN3394091.1 TIGR03761 family integrating conjugative element protein [Yersinia enterocolitica]HEJ7948281.1 TIGR03761 family integrating conjugative element protein [Serratia liquefaciens]EKN3528163.1 TIGR03761 family integrating conjugative element protein [Yersinia enterocolitica]EKN3635499.1 TIGR03761 family integrating conjugative element protein [Yersinia enterocolitica]EKN3831604.1 TIGR03761 famil
MTDNAEKKDGKKVGALHSELQIDLHTYYAISTWEGRERGARKDTIIGMPRFFRLVSSISRDSLADNPYADAVMYQLEKLIDEAHKNIQHLLNEANSIIADLPSGISLSSVVSSSPLNIGVHSHTPLGYRCVYLLVGFDQLALKLFQAHHYGFISRQHRDDQLHQGGYQIRKIFSAAQHYRSFPINRTDIVMETDTIHPAQQYFGDLDREVLLGKKRSRFSPPVNAESLRLLNKRSRHKSKDNKVVGDVDKQGYKDEKHGTE